MTQQAATTQEIFSDITATLHRLGDLVASLTKAAAAEERSRLLRQLVADDGQQISLSVVGPVSEAPSHDDASDSKEAEAPAPLSNYAAQKALRTPLSMSKTAYSQKERDDIVKSISNGTRTKGEIAKAAKIESMRCFRIMKTLEREGILRMEGDRGSARWHVV
jgi:hypothetical protein